MEVGARALARGTRAGTFAWVFLLPPGDMIGVADSSMVSLVLELVVGVVEPKTGSSLLAFLLWLVLLLEACRTIQLRQSM